MSFGDVELGFSVTASSSFQWTSPAATDLPAIPHDHATVLGVFVYMPALRARAVLVWTSAVQVQHRRPGRGAGAVAVRCGHCHPTHTSRPSRITRAKASGAILR
jgi:hypothetical protein